MIGSTIPRYRITAKLGEGGMGEVYRAADGQRLYTIVQAEADMVDRIHGVSGGMAR